jgi:hypothetical protein
MTAIVLNYSQSLLDGIWGFFKTTFKGIATGMILARANSVNHHVAEQLIRAGEYPHHTIEQLHYELNQKTLEELK